MDRVAAVILAAGKGTRMMSRRQKILHEVGGKPMVQHVFDAVADLVDSAPIFVIAPGEDGVPQLFGEDGEYVIQREQRGTGHATLMAARKLRGLAERVIVAAADMPLVREATYRQLLETQRATGAAVVLLSVAGDSASTYGRILRDDAGNIVEICEVANARRRPDGEQILALREQNASAYCFDADFLQRNIANLPLREARNGQEYYLTDMVQMAVTQGKRVEAVQAEDATEALGAGTRAELIAVDRAFRRRAVDRWLAAGVTIIDPATTYIDPDVTIGQDTIIWPNSYLQGTTTIGEQCVIGPNTIIRSATIGNRCYVEQAVVEGVEVPDENYVEPFTHALPVEWGDEA